MEESVIEKTKSIVADVLCVGIEDVKETSTLENLGADSLDGTELVIELEEEFSIKIDDREVSPEMTVKALADVVERTIEE